MELKISGCSIGLCPTKYFNEISSYVDLTKRVALAAVPFFQLHAPLKLPLSIVMDTRRVWNSDYKDVAGTAVAVIALAGTIFQHRVGLIVMTIQNIVIETGNVQKRENLEEISKSLFKIFSNTTSLALIAFGGLELAIILLVMQPVISLIQSRDEFKKGCWIEGISHCVMSGVRCRLSSAQYQLLTKN